MKRCYVIILLFILIEQLFRIDRKDASDCISVDKSCIEEPTAFSATDEISNNGVTDNINNICLPFRVGDDKLKGR